MSACAISTPVLMPTKGVPMLTIAVATLCIVAGSKPETKSATTVAACESHLTILPNTTPRVDKTSDVVKLSQTFFKAPATLLIALVKALTAPVFENACQKVLILPTKLEMGVLTFAIIPSS